MSVQTIDLNKCTGCGTCVNACPMDVLRRDFKKEENSPCTIACPAHINTREYMALMREGKIDEAMAVIRENNPIPAITGHVCYHPCESKCARQEVDETVNINGMERYIADYWLKEKATPAKMLYAHKIAVIGSGPAGLAAAYFLIKAGYPVTVFEKESKAGGMLRNAMPVYRMPEEVLDAQVQYIADMGVEFRYNMEAGKDFTLEGLKEEYSAVLVAVGKSVSRTLNISGAELEDVIPALDLLKKVRYGEEVRFGKKVVVIGGGNVAVDAARTAIRKGAEEVTMVCLESAAAMPAHLEEIEGAVAEGVKIETAWSPVAIQNAAGKVSGIDFVRCVSLYNKEGAFDPQCDDSVKKSFEADMVIMAIGQAADLSFLPQDVVAGSQIKADPVTLATELDGVFAAGDIVKVPGTVVDSIAAGREAWISIDRYVHEQDLSEGRGKPMKTVPHPPKAGIDEMPRQNGKVLTAEERTGNFNEIISTLDDMSAWREAKRCMGCGSKSTIVNLIDCQCCEACEFDCPNEAIYVSPEKYEPLTVAWR